MHILIIAVATIHDLPEDILMMIFMMSFPISHFNLQVGMHPNDATRLQRVMFYMEHLQDIDPFFTQRNSIRTTCRLFRRVISKVDFVCNMESGDIDVVDKDSEVILHDLTSLANNHWRSIRTVLGYT
jgi:hypothetical protein